MILLEGVQVLCDVFIVLNCDVDGCEKLTINARGSNGKGNSVRGLRKRGFLGFALDAKSGSGYRRHGMPTVAVPACDVRQVQGGATRKPHGRVCRVFRLLRFCHLLLR